MSEPVRKAAKVIRPLRLYLNNGELVVYGTGQPEMPTFSEEDAAKILLAAPDLLAACLAALEVIQPNTDDAESRTNVVIRQLEAAVKKAPPPKESERDNP